MNTGLQIWQRDPGEIESSSIHHSVFGLDNKTKQNKAKQNKTKHNKTKQSMGRIIFFKRKTIN
jgi:hypothetical protein